VAEDRDGLCYWRNEASGSGAAVSCCYFATLQETQYPACVPNAVQRNLVTVF
jgi:hypothetical protein